jgi:hypothetical protein
MLSKKGRKEHTLEIYKENGEKDERKETGGKRQERVKKIH